MSEYQKKKRLKKVAIVLPALNPGGAEQQVYHILKNWPNNKIIFIYFFEGTWSKKFTSTNVKSIKIDIKESKVKYVNLFINYWKRGHALKRTIISNKIDIIYTFLFEASIVGMIANFFEDFKQVSSVRFGSNHYLLKPIKLKKSIEYFLYKIIYNRSWKIIANSYEGVKTLTNDMKISSSKITIIRNGFDFEDNVLKKQSNNKRDKEKIIGFVGRLNLIKNPFHAMDVTSLLSKSYKIKLLIIGPEDGILISDLTKYAIKKNIDVEFTGNVERVNKYYRLMNVLILPSVQTEGCSNVIIEALSNGIPVVAYNVGDNKLLLDKKRGTVVEQKFPHLFAQSIEYYLNNNDDQKNKRIQFVIDNFNVKNMVNNTTSVLYS